jgi:Fe-S cluster assembly iron-binding protein IscA
LAKDIKIIMNNDLVDSLAEASIDYIDSSEGKGFVIKNPNAASGCGSCGGTCH